MSKGGNVYARDWTHDNSPGSDVDDCLDKLGRDHISEQTFFAGESAPARPED